jgi:integral membrane protein (TIGR01906 family)
VRRVWLSALTVLVAALVPVLLVTTSLRIVVNDWIVRFEYGLGGVPADRFGLESGERERLALLGLESISPGTRGVELLENARLPDGEPAFAPRELTHMQDVRDLVVTMLTAQLIAAAALAATGLGLAWPRTTRAVVPRGLRWGVLGTVALAAACGVAMLVAWDWFFESFHRLFFEGDTWRFPSSDTLIRLYPNEFWVGVGSWLAGLTVALGAAVWIGATLWLRRVAQEPGR